jgi:hypothetical protein
MGQVKTNDQSNPSGGSGGKKIASGERAHRVPPAAARWIALRMRS